MTTKEVFDIKALLIQEKDILDISDVLFLEVIPLVSNAMLACYPTLAQLSIDDFIAEALNRIRGWYAWTKHTPYGGELLIKGVCLLCEEYERLLLLSSKMR